VRRHRTAVTVCGVLYADVSPALRTPERAAQALILGAPGGTQCSQPGCTLRRAPFKCL
jgi:hypothetical protein